MGGDASRSVTNGCRNQELANTLREQAHASLRADSPQHHAFTAIARALDTFRYPTFVANDLYRKSDTCHLDPLARWTFYTCLVYPTRVSEE